MVTFDKVQKRRRRHVCQLHSRLDDHYFTDSKSEDLTGATEDLSQDLISNGDQSFALVWFGYSPNVFCGCAGSIILGSSI